MHKINHQSLTTKSLFGTSLEKLIQEDHPKKIILDKLPWDELVEIGERAYKSNHWKGKPNARVMVGLFIWNCISGDKTYREIADDFSCNILCAYACGFCDMELRTIDNSTLVKFEEHLGEENILEIKDIIEKSSVSKQAPNSRSRNTGDTTVFESNITFPTDTKLMESVRLFLVNDIIKVYEKDLDQKHRTYNRVARSDYLNFAKKRITNKSEIRKIKKKQLQYLKRNIAQANNIISEIENMTSSKSNSDKNKLWLSDKASKKAFKKLKAKLKLAELIYEQQLEIYRGNTKSIKNRIVSFNRPNVRPIFRGKAQKSTEFGVKAFLSMFGRALVLSKTSYDNFYDGHGYRDSITNMMDDKGYQIKEVIGDKGNGGICKFLKDNNIIDGIEKRGKRKKDPPIPKKRFMRARNKMEGAIGTLKNVFIKNRLRAKTDRGDTVKIAKACIGFNLKYAF